MAANIASFLKQFFIKEIPIDVPLEFNLDLNENGKHVVEVYMTIGGGRESVKNIHEIWSYGFIFERNGKRYIVSKESLETILSMRSLNPTIDKNGRMIFEVCPPVLRYLRSKKSSVNESPKSKEDIKISDEPLKPSAKIDYDKNSGLSIETGYTQKGKESLILKENLSVTSDGGYVRTGNTFYPIQEQIDPETKQWLDIKQKAVSLNEIPEFFKRDLVVLKTKLSVVLTEKAAAINIIDKPFQTRIFINKDEKGWLDFKIDYKVGEFIIPHNTVVASDKKYIHLEDNSWIHLDKSTIKETEKYLNEIGAQGIKEGFRLPVAQFFTLEELIEKIGGIKEVTASYKKFLDDITDFKADENFHLPEKIESCITSSGIQLRPYQRAGIHWLGCLTTHHLHGILADDMGLGKTIQTILAIRLAYEKEMIKQHSLIICPKSVVYFWSREFKRFYPEAKIEEYIGFSRDRTILKQEDPTIFISTYETVTRDTEYILPIPFYFVVLDEATKIKNPETQRTKAIKGINSIHRIALSGTPIENRPAELWSLFDFLMKGYLGTYGGFIRLFENPITQLGDDKVANKLSKRIRPFVLRRLKSEVAKDLPEKIIMEEWCELTEEQKSLYGQIQEQYASPVRQSLEKGEVVNYASCILPILTKLKQVCDHPALITGAQEPIDNRSEKFDFAIEKVKEIYEGNERVVLFSHFLKTLDLLGIAFERLGIKYIRLDGSTQNRQMYIDKFNNKEVDAAICSIQACGHGITLTAANHVIHIDHWWNPSIEDQATDRVHRIGQEKTVYVYSILTRGTLEEKIATLLEKKRNISDKVIGALAKEEIHWTREELLELLKPLES